MRRNWSVGRGLVLTALLCVGAMILTTPVKAVADGDPGSDELLAQNLFYGAGDGISFAQETKLGRLLNAASSAGAPVRVAIIGRESDLGAITALWGKPQEYSQFLAKELSLTYPGRLLVVMPSGYGVYWSANRGQLSDLASNLHGLKIAGDSGDDLYAAAQAAVLAIEHGAGVSSAKLAAAGALSAGNPPTTRGASSTGSESGSRPNSSAAAADSVNHKLPTGLFALVLLLIAGTYVALRRGWRPRRPPEGWFSRLVASLRNARIRPAALIPTLLLLVVLAALAINQAGHSSSSQAQDLEQNPGLDQGTQLTPKPAPDFKLIDEAGKPVSLKQYRGKVVILSFIDSECETLCPLTTQAMLDAKADLGPAGKSVQLLGVNANWRSIQVDDVQNYTEMHGLSGQWHFLTDSKPALERVWSAYGVNEAKLVNDEASQIDHVAATFVIDPRGRLREAFTTYSKYTAIPQQGQLLAKEASRLLPSHPTVRSHLSYAAVQGIPPTKTTVLPRSGGGSVTLGPGKSHLYLFFDTWDRQSTPIAGEMQQLLNSYQRDSKQLGLPAVTAIDESSVEPNRSALPAFLSTLHLDYPVAIDQTGRVGDGYGVQGEPWIVLTAPSGKVVWYREVYTQGWPTLATLEHQVRASLAPSSKAPTSAALKGSPPALASLHSQGSEVLAGGTAAFSKRLAALRGHPVVISVWASWCPPCQKEFPYFETASLAYGKRVAFLGYDFDDSTGNAEAFLREHHVAYPSYASSDNTIDGLVPSGITGPPATIFVNANGKPIHTQPGVYGSLGALEADIEQYSLHGR